jgi:gamma-glutamylcyclotransferase
VADRLQSLMVANPVTAIVVALFVLGASINIFKATFYSWYVLVLIVAFLLADEIGSRLYFYTFLLGMVTAFAEIIGKFKDEPLKALQTYHAIFYHVFNGLVAVFALNVFILNGGAIATELDQLKAVLIAGLGSMLLMRSKFFDIKVKDEDVSFGPDQIIKVFLTFMEGAIDRVRAQSRVDFVKARLANIDFDRVTPYTETMLDSAQTLEDNDRKDIAARINDLRNWTVMDTQLKSYRLGFLLLNRMGEDYVSKLFDKPPTEWLIKAPVAQQPEGLMTFIPPFIAPKPDVVFYFAYGASMCTAQFRERLGWSDPESAAFLQTTKPCKGTVSGYRVAFNKPVHIGNRVYGRANLVKDPAGTAEGVIYQLAKTAAEFLTKSEHGYRRQTVMVTLDGKQVEAQTFVGDTMVDGLHPTDDYMDAVLGGAREHGLSPEYIARLEQVVSTPEPLDAVALTQGRMAQSAPAAGTA